MLRDDKVGITAEFKRKSPSKGMINQYAPVEQTTIGYMQAGSSALSVLTDEEFFGGKNKDLLEARKFNYCPILRKDFVIDEYQITEARSIGADVVLLIASILEVEQIHHLAGFAKKLGLEVLLEVREKEDLEKLLTDDIDIVGVNNRDLKDFKVNIERSIELSGLIPERFIKISESGINSPEDYHQLKEAGYKGFLIGEQFMKAGRPERACARFIKQIIEYNKNEPQPA